MENLGIECKKLMAKEIKGRLKDSENLFIASFASMSVPEQDLLRHKLKEIEASIFIVKKRIVKQVFQQLDLEKDPSSLLMRGLSAIVLGGRDLILASKSLVDFADKHSNFKILGAYADRQLLGQNSIKRLASVGSKEMLLTQIVYGIKFPIQGLVNSLSATIRNFVVVLHKIQEKK